MGIAKWFQEDSNSILSQIWPKIELRTKMTCSEITLRRGLVPRTIKIFLTKSALNERTLDLFLSVIK